MILYLQELIYKQLNVKEITDKVNGIYYHVPSNNSFPYIFIGDFYQCDISTKSLKRANIRFKLSLYLREKSLVSSLKLTKEVKVLLENNDQMIMKCYEEKITIQNDGITQQIIMSFKTKLGDNHV